jgi:death-on-curing protein
MTLDPIFLTVEQVELLHGRALDEYGGQHGIRDRGALESAVAMPQAGFADEFLHPSLWLMASAYAFHIAENQPFIDGNKRAGLAAALVFLNLNGHPVRRSGGLHAAMIAISTHTLDKPGLAKLFEDLANPS